jgi:capsular polysaccharide biosynthesis protein
MSVLSHWKPIVAAVLLGLAAGGAYLLLAEDRYAAEAKLLVVPRPSGDATFEGFGLPRVSGGGSSAETVADLVERPSVVDPAAVQLRLDRDDVLDAVTVRADDESNVVIVRAEADDPQRAAQIANAVADEFVSERSGTFQGELNRTIAQLREELRNVPASERDVPPAASLVARLTALRAFLGERDPTVRVAGNAVASDRVVWPRPVPVLAVALLGSLLLGLAVAALMAAAARRRAPPPPTEDPLLQRETMLTERARAVAKRERALAKGEAALDERAQAVDDREESVAKRGSALGERVRTVTERERALARQAGELAAREREFELEREAALQAAEPEPEPEREPELAVPAELLGPAGAWNVVALERLVEKRGSEFPDRVEEWQAYLFFLREHASMEGTLPPSFDALVDEAFHELLA